MSCFLTGFLVTLKYLISLSKWIFATFLRSEIDLIRTYGSWAMVTGATDGIGKAMAHRLAHRGLNIILVSRSSQRLETVAAELQAQHPHIVVKAIQMDFSGDTAEGLRRIAAATQELDVGILINNVGITYPGAMFFDKVEEKVWRKIVRVNVEGTTRVTRAVVVGMMERRRGAIVNIGSGASVVIPSHPLYSIYAASKAYVDQLSRSLYVEYKQYGIHVQCQVPLYVATKMVSKVACIEKDSLFVPTPEAYAKAAIREIGHGPRCTPYWAHSIQWFFASLTPDPLLDAWRFSIAMRRFSTADNTIYDHFR
ncbi:Very-long-chain 3-oxoacyl-CoA reductase-like protein [Stylosanthes scabra]|uniref:Very-long-chain 3-oxoacyl-CoA reductase-like protein n=1 Tax=Stylosanthes scabra TaxID=79078 RepID=A0ABU6R6J1_9FABA|nr:Very-long-chain 3-oxoacyl-CoA reductase-like protein [Stylosanthes scabra]